MVFRWVGVLALATCALGTAAWVQNNELPPDQTTRFTIESKLEDEFKNTWYQKLEGVEDQFVTLREGERCGRTLSLGGDV